MNGTNYLQTQQVISHPLSFLHSWLQDFQLTPITERYLSLTTTRVVSLSLLESFACWKWATLTNSTINIAPLEEITKKSGKENWEL